MSTLNLFEHPYLINDFKSRPCQDTKVFRIPGLRTHPVPRWQKWTRFIIRANIACQRVVLWTRVNNTRMWTQDPTSRLRPRSLRFSPHPLLCNMKKERHDSESSPSNPRKRQRNVPQRHRGHLDDPQARVKNRTYVRFAAKNMRKFGALGDITKLNTIPVHVCQAPV